MDERNTVAGFVADSHGIPLTKAGAKLLHFSEMAIVISKQYLGDYRRRSEINPIFANH